MKNHIKLCFSILALCVLQSLHAQPLRVDGYLVVNGTYTQSFQNANRRFYGPNGAQLLNNNSIRWAIQAFGEIDAHGYWANSDRRIKRNITDVSPEEGLSIIQKLTVRNYNFKDTVERGSTPVVGFIAQEVDQVFPQAVSQCTKVIPDVYQSSKQVICNNTTQTMCITMAGPIDLKNGDRVRIVGHAKNLVEVTNISGNTFQVKGWPEQDTKEVFVYGKEVDDFDVVNYDRIFTMNVVATQELMKEVEMLKSQVAELVTFAQVLKKENAALKTEVQSVKEALFQPLSASNR